MDEALSAPQPTHSSPTIPPEHTLHYATTTTTTPSGSHPAAHAPPHHRASTSSSHRARRSSSTKAARDPNLDINLPYRTLTSGANLDEYRVQTAAGEIPGPGAAPGGRQYKLVTFLPDDPGNPKNWSKAYKWYCTMVVALTCFVVAFASSVITADVGGVVEEFGVSYEVALVSISVFVVGFGVGE